MKNRILKKNQEALKGKYTDIYEEILCYDLQRAKDLEENQITDISLLNTREEAKALVVKKKESKDIRMNSIYYPIREAKQWADQFEYQNISSNVILYGMGNGIFVREILKHLEKEGHLLIVEPDYSLFVEMIEKVDLSDILWNQKVELFFYHRDENKIMETISAYLSWASLDTTIRVIHPGYDKVFEDKVEEYRCKLDRICEKVKVNINTMVEFSDSAVYNVIHNLKFIKKSNYINELIGVFPKDYPAVVVSAGPSLKKNLDMLRKLQDKAFILVVDTAVKVLEEKKIPYDAIVLIDPEKPAEFLTDYPGCREKTLFCTTVSPVDIMDFHKGRKIWLPNSVWIHEEYKKLGMETTTHSIGGSVATAATEVARIVGIKRIILVGQDLAYLGQQTHAGRKDVMGEERGYISRWVEGVDGGKVRTRWDWVYYLHWFEKFVIDHPEITLIDATEGGALIHGSKVLTLEEAIQRYAGNSFSFEEYLKKLPRTFDIHEYESMHRDILKMKNNMKELSIKCKTALQYLEIFEENEKYTLQELDKSLFKCMKMNMEFVQIEGDELIELGISKKLKDKLDKVNFISGDERKDKVNTARMLKEYYHAVIEVSEKILEYFSKIETV